MTITALPTPPSRNDPANFAERGDAFLGALPQFVTEANALQADVNAKAEAAATAASTASSKAGEASASASAASTKAAEALASAGTAGTKAGEAAASAVDALASKNTAADWAQKIGAAVVAGMYSAKEWAVGTFTRGTAGGGSAKDWATYTGGKVDDTEYSAKYYANQAASTLSGKANLSGADFTGPITTTSNAAIGTTLSVWNAASKVVQLPAGSIESRSGALGLWSNAYYSSGSNPIYSATGRAANFYINDGAYYWLTAASGTAGGAVSFSQPMTLDANGNLLVGVTSGSSHVIQKNVAAGNYILSISGSSLTAVSFKSGDNFGVSAADAITYVGKQSSTSRSINAAGTVNASGADYAEYMHKSASCGVIEKGAICGVNANGELTDKWSESVSFLIKSTDPSYVGGDTWGSEDALELVRPVEPQFVMPEYTGAADPGEAPVAPIELEDGASEDQVAAYLEALDQYAQAAAAYNTAKVAYDLDQAEYAARVEVAKQIFDEATYPTYLQELATFEAALEAARQKVDRIAFSGQVPVNVKGAKPGQYVVPVQAGTGIGGKLVNKADMTLPMYMDAVGIVQNILPDGRANVRVKVV